MFESGLNVSDIIYLLLGSFPTDSFGLGIDYWRDSTKTYILIPLSEIDCASTTNIALVWNFELTFPSAGAFVFAAYLVDGSSLTHLKKSQTRVADPATSETISSTQIINAYCEVS